MIKKYLRLYLKNLLSTDRSIFNKINQGYQLQLQYSANRDAVKILSDIFIQREYALFFPFYEKVTIVDIGAHYGYFALFAAKNVAKNSQILCFEPSCKNFDILSKNVVNQTSPRIVPVNAAVSDKIGTAKLSLAPNSFNHNLTERTKEKDNLESVKTITLEHLMNEHQLDKIDFLKLDCEGAEYAILFSTPKIVLDQIQTISMEFHDSRDPDHSPNQLYNFLEKNGFRVVHFQFYPDRLCRNLNYGRLVATKGTSPLSRS